MYHPLSCCHALTPTQIIVNRNMLSSKKNPEEEDTPEALDADAVTSPPPGCQHASEEVMKRYAAMLEKQGTRLCTQQEAFLVDKVDLPLDQLVPASGMYLLRPRISGHAEDLARKVKARGFDRGLGTISVLVMEEPNKYLIWDGNHRYISLTECMTTAEAADCCEGYGPKTGPDSLKTYVPCTVYESPCYSVKNQRSTPTSVSRSSRRV